MRPYKYAYHHKDEIEKQVNALLVEGAIKHITDPFSSPVILVKKDGSWRMCMGYRALNKVTIPNKYPIPAINELRTSCMVHNFFSKNDLESGFDQIHVKDED